MQGLFGAPMPPDRSAAEAAKRGWQRALKPGSSLPQRVLLALAQAPLVRWLLARGRPPRYAAGEGPSV